MKFVVLIPARLSASRLPRKPLLDLAGIPMVVRVAQRAQLSQASQTVVATDSAEIMQVCKQFGIQSLLTRADHPSGS
ncbi:MAG: 3-deoxy-manno-octulosonate cytidylyltransferase, partial [Burkholderiales bacterium]|nr:3-deoxy-manno-octulosonate cytidylyltransferase [Burkholderiales bacterium]